MDAYGAEKTEIKAAKHYLPADNDHFIGPNAANNTIKHNKQSSRIHPQEKAVNTMQ
jgi:hypothetical protein